MIEIIDSKPLSEATPEELEDLRRKGFLAYEKPKIAGLTEREQRLKHYCNRLALTNINAMRH